jgi:AcrR family transcriptional regulator
MTDRPLARHHRAIVDAAAAILADDGLPGLNVSALMRHAGISRTAFSREFGDI